MPNCSVFYCAKIIWKWYTRQPRGEPPHPPLWNHISVTFAHESSSMNRLNRLTLPYILHTSMVWVISIYHLSCNLSYTDSEPSSEWSELYIVEDSGDVVHWHISQSTISLTVFPSFSHQAPSLVETQTCIVRATSRRANRPSSKASTLFLMESQKQHQLMRAHLGKSIYQTLSVLKGAVPTPPSQNSARRSR